jgi:glutamyl-tRNA synthetase
MNVTRLAPSPTGALHLGNARTFLVNWLLARRNDWKILLRIEDLDGPRVKSGADRQLIDDLQFLGLDWDQGPIYQSARAEAYSAAIDSLIRRGLAYPCICTRREVDLAQSAPHADDGSTVYPGTCRGKFATVEDAVKATGKNPAIRFAVPDRDVEFNDTLAGKQKINVARKLGDFVIAKADGLVAYQLAVVVDDLEAGITDVVRGDDLLESTFRQILIHEALGAATHIPQYTHLPLVIGEDGRRLAKRHGDTRIATYRKLGVESPRLLSLLARWCGIFSLSPAAGISGEGTGGGDAPAAENQAQTVVEFQHPKDLLPLFNLQKIPKSPIVFTPQDDAWLRQKIG